VIAAQPITPTPPHPGTITVPTCITQTGSVHLVDLPSSGTWTLTRYPGTIRTTGTGPTATVQDLTAGIYNFSVTNNDGCISSLSVDVIIPSPPPSPLPPVISTITQPILGTPTGSVTLSGLPSTESWTILRYPGPVSTTGSGTEITITGLDIGAYTFRVRNNSGCLSAESGPVVITAPTQPGLVITDPLPVCFPAAVDLTAPAIKEGSTAGLTFTYWRDDQATIPLESPTTASDGLYYIKGTASSGYFDIKPVKATVRQPPVSNAGPDQILAFQFATILQANLKDDESGIWSSDSTDLTFNDITDPHTSVSNLSSGANVLSWIVSNGICPADTDKVTIKVGELLIPTLLTPNGDSRNDYFVIGGLETLGKAELIIFDRRGIQLYRNSDYDNKWDGVDDNNNPLINDTYFFVLKSTNGKSYSGYVVIRK
jgi:gliding motility-associated-like protein